jgi:plasmid rolling circle replication initiator protein Rep
MLSTKASNKHRVNAEQVSNYYATAEEYFFNEYPWRVKRCSELLEFQLLPEESENKKRQEEPTL